VTSDEIRQLFLDFFQTKQHAILPSSSLIPHDDPTLLLTTAGMVQIKPYFLGVAVPPNLRLASCQKCFRTTDIDSVGDAKHLTFFEMLGNFSVGDYFKEEAIKWAWEFVIQYLNLPPERLWITVYLDDDEAYDIWRKNGIPENKIVRLGEEDNFWGPAGDSGPCGPCSEIHYDFGEQFGCGKPGCNPGCDCGRFSEIWNLVFTQFNQDRDGNRTPLPKPNIDTGMGLERTAVLMQGVTSVYDTDMFMPIRKIIGELSGIHYGNDGNNDRAIRILAEHSRGVTFLITDGVLPSNEGRGYVLRRLLRKASFFGRKLGIDGPFLSRIADVVVRNMGHTYPELVANRDFVQEIITAEEEKFISTLDAGINLVEKAISEVTRNGEKVISGKEVFRLYDTYGFPPELTGEIAGENGLSIDLDGFEADMENQRARARAGQKFVSGDVSSDIVVHDTCFKGYSEVQTRATVKLILDNNSNLPVERAYEGNSVAIVLDETPFYGEMGGQKGDSGKLIAEAGEVEVIDTTWTVPGETSGNALYHIGRVVKGNIAVDDKVDALIDVDRRLDIARNHTATHLLQAALRQILGNHVYQRGSLVAPDRLRFDFSHMKNIDKKQLKAIQALVNDKIRQNLPVTSRENVRYQEAVDEGAIALFGEKYGDTVRVMKIGEPSVSVELCGGTHVNSTGEIGTFIIVSEGSIGTGLRRIEAVTGRGAEKFIMHYLELLNTVARDVKSTTEEVPQKVKSLLNELSAERKRLADMERKLSKNVADDLIGQKKDVEGISVIAAKVQSSSIPVLRGIGDEIRAKMQISVVVLGSIYDGKPGFIAMITPGLVDKGLHAGKIIQQVAGITGGGGGGKADVAQAGGKDKSKIDEALAMVPDIVRKAL
jgi:alanyl-tRNA synthetase